MSIRLTPLRALLFSPLVVLAACATTSSPQGGKYLRPGDTYESPLHNCAVPVMQLGLGTKAQHSSDDQSGFVSIHDDFGSLYRLDYLRLTPPPPADLSARDRDSIYHGLLDNFVATNHAELLAQEPMTLDGHDMLFTIVFIPQGSPLMDMKTGKHLDSTRGILLFIRGEFAYAAMVQFAELPFTPVDPSPSPEIKEMAEGKVPPEKLAAPLKKELASFYKTIVFH